MPSSITIAAGQTTGTFTLATNSVASPFRVTVTALIGSTAAPSSFAQAQLFVASASNVPSVAITAPADQSTVSAPATIRITGSATPNVAGATITKVDYFNGTTQIGESTVAPYEYDWLNVPVGTYTLTAVATDSNGLSATSAPVHVTASNVALLPTPTISPSPSYPYFGSVNVSIADTDPSVTLFYTLDGTNPTTASPQYTGPFILAASTTPITVTARAAEPGFPTSNAATATYSITPVSGLTAPTVAITSPTDGAEITGPTAIIGSVTSTALAYWIMDYQSVGSGGWVPFARGTSNLNNSVTGNLDTTLMLDGQYDVRLTAVDQQGQSVQTVITIVIKGHQKVGYFTVSFTDMTVHLAGIPISITRTYDSRDKTNGDFGVGWTLSTTTAKLQKRQVSGYNWNQIQQGGGFSQTFVLQAVRPHLITITLPGDTVYSFEETVSPYGQSFTPLDATTVVYQQLSGPKAALAPVGADPQVLILPATFGDDPNIGGVYPIELYDGADPTQIYNPTEFVLTMHNGSKFDVSQANGLQTITDHNGNVVTFSHNGSGGCTGISSQDGRSITINRLGVDGSISSIKDLNGNSAQYNSDSFGNLASYTDRNGNTSTYDYDFEHNLTGIHDPSGVVPKRNYYKADGRLDYSLDANNNRLSYNYPPNVEQGGTAAPSSQTVTDYLGNPTTDFYDGYGNVTSKTQYLSDANHVNTPVTFKYIYNPSDPNNPDKKLAEQSPLGTSSGDPTKFDTSYSYDAQGNLLTVTDPLGNTTTSTYNSQGQPLTVTDALGIVVASNSYDNNGNLLSRVDAQGSTSFYTYNRNGTRATAEDPKGNYTRYSYDNLNNVASIQDAQGHVKTFSYDSNGNKTGQTETRTNAQGQMETNEVCGQHSHINNI